MVHNLGPSIRVRGNYAYSNAQTAYTTYNASSVSSTTIGTVVTNGAYTYAGFDLVATPRTRIAIDPNVRVRGNGTYASFDDVTGAIAVNEPVQVYEPESGLTGEGRVTDIDPERELVYLSVDWASLKEETPQRQPAGQIGGVLYLTPDQATIQDDWMEVSAQPSLVYVGWSGTTLQVTAPAAGWWNPPTVSGAGLRYPEIFQPYAGFTTDLVVSA